MLFVRNAAVIAIKKDVFLKSRSESVIFKMWLNRALYWIESKFLKHLTIITDKTQNV